MSHASARPLPPAWPRTHTKALLAAGGQALWTTGDLRSSREWFAAAYRAAERCDDPEAMASAALGLAGLGVDEHRGSVDAAVLNDRLHSALAAVPADSALALRLRARLAGEAAYHSGDHAELLATAEQASRTGDAVAAVEALSVAHQCLLGPAHGPARRRLAEDIITQSGRTGRPVDVLVGVLWRTIDLILDADLAAGRGLAELRGLLADHPHLAIDLVVRAIDVMLDIRAGRFGRAEQRAAECAERGATVGNVDAAGWYSTQLVAIRWFQGRIVELLPLLTELVDAPTLSTVDHSGLAALAMAAATAGDRRQAEGALARIGGGDLGQVPQSSTWLLTMYGVVEAAHLLGDAALAGQAYELLTPFSSLPVVAGPGVACFGSVQHALGVAALTVGNANAAAEHLRDAVHENLALGNWPAAVLARYRLAGADRRQGAAARREARELGMTLPADRSTAVTCVRAGRHWRIGAGPRSAVVENSKGIGYLAVLIANPRREIPAVELAAGTTVAAALSAQPVLDKQAMRQYRERLAVLQREIERCDAVGDRDAAVRAHAERDWLLEQVRSAVALNGRDREFTTSEELARIAVGKAIRRALRRIAEADAVIGELLSTAIHTGRQCSYHPLSPDEGLPVSA